MSHASRQRLFGTFFIFLLLITLTALTSCSSSSTAGESEKTQIDRVVLDRRIGKIESLRIDQTTARVTHLLKMEDGNTVLLTSTALDLDDPKYQEKTLEVSGILNFTTQNRQPLMNVQSIDILADTPTQELKVVSWKDYSNEVLGFSFRYRDDFTLTDSDSFVTLRRERTVKDDIRVPPSDSGMTQASTTAETSHHEIHLSQEMTSGQSLLEYLQLKSDSSTDLAAAHFTKSRIGSQGIEAFKKVGNDGKHIDFYFERNGKTYHFSYHGSNDPQSLEDQNVFYDVMGSFRLQAASTTLPSADSGSIKDKALSQTVTTSPVSSPKTSSNSPSAAVETLSQKDVEKTESEPEEIQLPTGEEKSLFAEALSAPSDSQELLPGYERYESSSYKFSLQYPKKWYFSSGTSSESSVIKHYDFGTKPLEEESGTIALDILSGALPSGESTTVQGVPLVKVVSDDGNVQYYVKGSKNRVYRVTGPSSVDSSLASMAATIQD